MPVGFKGHISASKALTVAPMTSLPAILTDLLEVWPPLGDVVDVGVPVLVVHEDVDEDVDAILGPV